MLVELPQDFIRNILGLYEIEGARWIIDLRKIVSEIERKWSLRVGMPYPNLSYHFVAPCLCDGGGEAVLKIGIPEPKSPIFSENKILKTFDGKGAVKLLDFDETHCALLLEKLSPGENLLQICRAEDAKANSIAIKVMQRLQTRAESCANGDFPTLAEWVSGLRKAEKTDFAPREARKARRYFDELIDGSAGGFLLHGDLHHQNILSATREPFLAIDPKGIIGNIGFEFSTFLNNPRGWVLSHPEQKKILSGRLRQFSEAFEIEPLELRKWAYAEAVLSAWWTFEEGRTDCEKWIACAHAWEV